ncbi:hypothetical protein VNO78_11290 [Psophocarpus tetragonolobus]|uniref:Uncharacterized protein n=1 Tax=Psophocarpus tetragonolobus TaxID=3891 RepID=A0AAN9XNI9_PSOTE
MGNVIDDVEACRSRKGKAKKVGFVEPQVKEVFSWTMMSWKSLLSVSISELISQKLRKALRAKYGGFSFVESKKPW